MTQSWQHQDSLFDEVSKLKSLIEQQKSEIFLLKKILYDTPGSLYWKNKDGVYMYRNHASAESMKRFNFPWRWDEIVGKTDYELFPKEMADGFRNHDIRVMESKIASIKEEYSTLPSGETAIQLSTKKPLYDRNGEVIGIIGNTVDITDRKRVEEREKIAVAAAVAAETKAKFEAELRQAVTILSGSIVHDLRGSLAGLSASGESIEDYFPKLLHGYQLAKEAGLPVEPLVRFQLEGIKQVASNIPILVNRLQEFITQTLKALHRTVAGILTSDDLVPCATWKYINQLLDTYPFIDNQRALIHYDGSYYFTFMGNPVLFIRILSNLIKNSLYQIEKHQRGDIFIHAEKTDTRNIIRFRDTARGASPKIVAHLFDGYNSHTEGGTGVGLSSCKLMMQSMGGDMTCHSVEGEYIEFMLSFPAMIENE